jgi:hypothetical protein
MVEAWQFCFLQLEVEVRLLVYNLFLHFITFPLDREAINVIAVQVTIIMFLMT